MKYNHLHPIDFNSYTWSSFIPKLKLAMMLCEERINKIKNSEASFENTVLAFETCDVEMNELNGIFSLLSSVNKDPEKTEEVDQISLEMNELTNKFDSKIMFDQDLFKKFEEVYNNRSLYFGEDLLLITEIYEGYIESGINLEKYKQDQLSRLGEREGEITIKIASNIEKEPENWSINITKEEALGIPQDTLELAKEYAEERNEEGYTFKADDVNFYTVVENARSQNLRIKFTELMRSIGNNDDKYDNKELIRELMKVRKETANILGFKNHPELVLKHRMVKNVDTVNKFLNNLEAKLKPAAKQEIDALSAMAKEDGIELTIADEWYYESKMKSKMCNIDLNKLREYFSYDHVWNGFQTFANQLYGISFEKNDNPTYDPAVEVYTVKDGLEVLGVIYMDSFARDSKKDGAWMQPIIDPSQNHMPIILVANNFTPKKNNESLMSIMDVKTLFHELGHALHVLFSKSKYQSFGGINVSWDFVELPSQIMENFVCDKVVLDLIAKHKTTGELLSDETIANIKRMDNLFNASGILSYVGLGKIDLNLHTQDPENLSFDEASEEYDSCRLGKKISNKVNHITNFEHILSGGYDVGYYSYQWAKVLDSNCFELFKKESFSKEIANSFREKILSRGSTRDELKSFIDFYGSEPTIEPFLKLSGVD